MKSIIPSINLFLFTALFAVSCSGDRQSETGDGDVPATSSEQGLSTFEQEHGIGPVTESLQIEDEIDEDLAERGKNIFEMKCEMCHGMESRVVGPPLGEVAGRRSPEFMMNFILNPSGMTREHPVGQELLREYLTAMPFQNVKEEDARAIVEFLRNYYRENH